MPMTINDEVLPLTSGEETCSTVLMGVGFACCLCTLGTSFIPLCVFCCCMAKKYGSEDRVKAGDAPAASEQAAADGGNNNGNIEAAEAPINNDGYQEQVDQ